MTTIHLYLHWVPSPLTVWRYYMYMYLPGCICLLKKTIRHLKLWETQNVYTHLDHIVWRSILQYPIRFTKTTWLHSTAFETRGLNCIPQGPGHSLVGRRRPLPLPGRRSGIKPIYPQFCFVGGIPPDCSISSGLITPTQLYHVWFFTHGIDWEAWPTPTVIR